MLFLKKRNKITWDHNSRNDRRIRYLIEIFNSFKPKRSKSVTINSPDNGDETKLNSKFDLSSWGMKIN